LPWLGIKQLFWPKNHNTIEIKWAYGII